MLGIGYEVEGARPDVDPGNLTESGWECFEKVCIWTGLMLWIVRNGRN